MNEEHAGVIPAPAKEPRRTPREKVTARTPGRKRADGIRSAQIAGTGKIIPACPMTPDELVEQWGIGADDSLTITVKVMRQVIGDTTLELIQSVPLVNYSGEEIARNFGPGTYYLRPAAGVWAKNSAKVPISEALARSCGWGKIPVTPTPQDIQAQRIIQRAAEAPQDPLDLLAAVQQVVRRELEGAGIRPGSQGGQLVTAPQNPMEAMQTQMAQMNAWMTFMDKMEANMQARLERRMGLPESEPANQNQSLMDALLPLGLKLLDRMSEGPRMLPQPVRQALPPIPQPQPAAPEPQQTPQGGSTMPMLTPLEQQAIAPVVKMLQPFGPQLVQIVTTPATDEQIVGELEGYIPDNMVEGLDALNQCVKAHGKEVLSVIHPGLASDRWAGILPKLCEALR